MITVIFQKEDYDDNYDDDDEIDDDVASMISILTSWRLSIATIIVRSRHRDCWSLHRTKTALKAVIWTSNKIHSLCILILETVLITRIIEIGRWNMISPPQIRRWHIILNTSITAVRSV